MKNASVTSFCTITLSLAACVETSGPLAPKIMKQASLSSVNAPTVVVYSNFGSGMAFDSNPFHGWGVNGFLSVGTGQQTISQRFTPSSDHAFASASVALSYFSGPMAIRVFLQSDTLGRPGAVLEQLPLVLGSNTAVYGVSSTLSPVLQGGVPYWLTIAAGADGVIAGWNWNSTGDVSTGTFAATQGGGPSGPWGVQSGLTRGAFEIKGRALGPRGVILHQASGGGTVIWPNGQRVTYGINAREFADGSVRGELLFHEHGSLGQFKGSVRCLTVVGNRAHLTGDITQSPPTFSFRHFAIGLEDNGEGDNARGPDRISSLLLLEPGLSSCRQSFPAVDWTHGNAQVR